MRRKMNKVLSLSMALMLTISLFGCGSTANPAVGGDVVENTESTMVSSGDDATTTMETDKESTTKTEIKDGEVATTDKPEETSAPTATPEPTASPEPTTTPEPTASPEPTATPEPHVHEYVESITVQPTCAVAGEKKLTCSCGDTKTESIPASGEHNWVEQTQIVHHDEVGSTKTVQVGTNKRTVYYCSYCRFTLGLGDDAFSSDNEADITNHQAEAGQAILDAGGTRDEAIAHAFANGFCIDYYDPVYEEQYIVQSPAYDETVVTGYVCSVCGATK